ncbi:MAG: sulfatase-like hydrolase/transferase, partial [Lentisphaerae bacterium]|nr:sulfatase-like hydrolase/transferase [Lentisphaerota bacterium]
TSDHGEMLGDHYGWRKQVPYEASARVPLLFSAPPRFGLKRLSTVDQPVCLEDIMPTLLDLAGAPIPKTVEGRSLLPLMRGETIPWRDYLPIEHAPLHQSLTDGREKYIWFVRDGREQFFDLTADPLECHDLAREPAASARMAVWRKRLVHDLKARPEGFSDGHQLIPGRPYAAALKRTKE